MGTEGFPVWERADRMGARFHVWSSVAAGSSYRSQAMLPLRTIGILRWHGLAGAFTGGPAARSRDKQCGADFSLRGTSVPLERLVYTLRQAG